MNEKKIPRVMGMSCGVQNHAVAVTDEGVRRYSESMGYTFGDNQEASRRLRRLAEVYETETRDLLDAVRSECNGGGHRTSA